MFVSHEAAQAVNLRWYHGKFPVLCKSGLQRTVLFGKLQRKVYRFPGGMDVRRIPYENPDGSSRRRLPEAFTRPAAPAVSSYPGTPSTEITECRQVPGDLRQWAPNEKVAMEAAFSAMPGPDNAASAA